MLILNMHLLQQRQSELQPKDNFQIFQALGQ
jgi:hypothetical protein